MSKLHPPSHGTRNHATNYLLWDFDGTLGYRDGMWSGTLLTILQREAPDLSVGREQIRPYMQTGFPWNTPDQPHPHLATAELWWESRLPLFAGAFAAQGVEAGRAQALARRVRAEYIDLANWHMYEDTLPTLQSLCARGWRHAVLSNHVPELGDILRHLGLEAYFTHLFNSAITGYEKPHPEAFRLALATLGPVASVWMIGDNPQADVAGAEAMGIPAILVRKSHPQAPRFCPDLTQLITFLDHR
jgi:putative hydrolase of the HAD superfamily